MNYFIKKIKELLPGFIVCLIIALISQFLSTFIPSIGSALIAILIGMVAGNTFFNKEIYDKGSKFSESRLLEYSIVLMGLTLELSNLLAVGLNGIAYIAILMTLTIIATYLIGQKLGFSCKFSLLMCSGNAVCGSSAIGTVSPIVKADSKDKGISITIVNITGTVLMILLPLITSAIYNHETIKTSAMIGGTLQSIGQVIASGKLVNDPVTEMSTIFKIVRIIFLVFVAMSFSNMNTSNEGKLFNIKNSNTKTKTKTRIPWFIIGFFIFTIINSTGILPEIFSTSAKSISNQFEIIALAAIGMRVKFADLIHEGPKALLYGGFVGTFQIICSIILIFILF